MFRKLLSLERENHKNAMKQTCDKLAEWYN